MGLGIGVVSADAGVSCDQRSGFWLSRGKREAADVLRGYAAAGSEYWLRVADGRGVRLWREVSGEVSEGALHHGLVVWAADCRAHDAVGVELFGHVGKFRRAKIAAR